MLLVAMVMGLSASAATILIALKSARASGSGSIGHQQLVETYPWVALFDQLPIIGPFVATHPLPAAAILGFIGGVAGAWGLAGTLHDFFLASFNTDVLKPVVPQLRPDREERHAGFVSLPWILGAGRRRAVWDQLVDWARKGVRARQGYWIFSKPTRPLTMTVLTGRAGSGKSRMAYELALHLSQRTMDTDRGQAFARLRAWATFALAPGRIGTRTPWDVALIPLPETGQGRDRGLKEWRPRRPTLILLDDPGPGQSAQIWSTLEANASLFRHPVRLLVANQSVPYDSGYAFSDTVGESGGWTFHGSPADTPPIVLPLEAWFTEAETTMLARRANLVGAAASAQSAVGQTLAATLFKVTRGNPLLVQLAFEWVREKQRFDDVSPEALSEARIDRILAALQQNGVGGRDSFAALALASLVGGVARDVLESIGLDRLPSNNELQACFPADDLGRGELPPVRPEMIADRFIDRVVRQFSIAPQPLAEQGFRLSPTAMLRVLRRARPASSPFGAALVSIDPRTIDGLDGVRYGLALCELAAICQHDDWPPATPDDHQRRTALALQAVEGLGPAERARFRAHFVQLLQSVRGVDPARTIRFAPAFEIYAAALQELVPDRIGAFAGELRLFAELSVLHWEGYGTLLFESEETIGGLARKLDEFLSAGGARSIGPGAALRLAQSLVLLDIRRGPALLPAIFEAADPAAIGRVDARLWKYLRAQDDPLEEIVNTVASIAREPSFNAAGSLDPIIAACGIFLSLLAKIREFDEENEAHAAYKKWAIWASAQLRRATKQPAPHEAQLRLTQIALFVEAEFWSFYRTRRGGVSSLHGTPEHLDMLWEMLLANLQFAERAADKTQLDLEMLCKTACLLVARAGGGQPMISSAFAAFLQKLHPNGGQRESGLVSRVELAEVYSSCGLFDEECAARFQRSTFGTEQLRYFEGYYALKLEACRLAHIAACDLPKLGIMALALEGMMHKIIDTYQTELDEHALVWARL